MENYKGDSLKPALKTPKRVSILDNFHLGEDANVRYAHSKLPPPSPLNKVNYIKATRASQILYLKNNKGLSPLLQIELNTNKYELGRLPHLAKKKKFDYKKATESLTPIKETISKIKHKNGDSAVNSTHIANLAMETGVKTKKLEPIASQIMINLSEDNSFDEFHLEKYINMMNIDQEVFYLGSSFLSVFLESVGNTLSKNKNPISMQSQRKFESQSLSSRTNMSSLNIRFTNHYSNKNLTNLSKLSMDSLTTSNTNKSVTLTKNKLLSLNSDSKLSAMSDYDERATLKPSLFGINFPIFRLEQFKENILTLKYPNSKYHFMRILMKSNLKVEMDIGFIELEVNEKKYVEVHKLYIIKVYRKMEIYENIMENLFKNLFKLSFTKSCHKIFMKVLDRFESYKALLGKLGFLLNQKVKIKEEYIAYMVLKNKV